MRFLDLTYHGCPLNDILEKLVHESKRNGAAENERGTRCRLGYKHPRDVKHDVTLKDNVSDQGHNVPQLSVENH